VDRSRDESFVPDGARARWPFRVGGPQAYRQPTWAARPLLWWGVVEALARLQSTHAGEYWTGLEPDYLESFMHAGSVGVEHPSRRFAAELVGEGESVLDVGCGPGANYEVLAWLGRTAGYVGVDASAAAVEVARTKYPAGDFRVGDAAALTDHFGARSFDVVVVRHLLEHLPDFEAVMSQAIAVARRLSVFVFFLTPRSLPLRVRKVNLRYGRPQFLYVYSREAIEELLAGRGVPFAWHQGVGTSRAGWFGGEVNSVLVVDVSAAATSAAGTRGRQDPVRRPPPGR
jgi:SAM-dependent methyltransferase